MNKLRILLADDHDSFRRVLASFLRALPGVELVGEAVDGSDAIEQSFRLRPDLVLIDVHMPKTSGVDATKIIKMLNPAPKVVMMSIDPSEQYRRKALEIADAYVPKTSLKHGLTSILGTIVVPEHEHVAAA